MRILVIAMILASGSTFAPSPTKMQLAARRPPPPPPTPAVAMIWRPPAFFENKESVKEMLVCPHPCAPLCSTHACTSRIG